MATAESQHSQASQASRTATLHDRSSVAEGVPSTYAEGSHHAARYLMLSNARTFTKAIVALSRIGDVLLMEPSRDGMTLMSFNKPRTAFGLFRFSTDFFSSVDVSLLSPVQSNNCRLSMKSALTIFRCAQSNDRNLYSCEIVIDPGLDTILFKMTHNCDVTRCYELPMLDVPTDHFRAVENKKQLRNRIEVLPEVLTRVVAQASSDSQELVITVTKQDVTVRNFDPKLDETSISTMEMCLAASNFLKFNIRRETEISFCLKEFKSLVGFASEFSVPINLHFDRAGKPLIMSVSGGMSYTAEVRIGTLEADGTAAIEDNDDDEPMEEEEEADDRRPEPIQQHNQTVGVYDGEMVGMEDEEESRRGKTLIAGEEGGEDDTLFAGGGPGGDLFNQTNPPPFVPYMDQSNAMEMDDGPAPVPSQHAAIQGNAPVDDEEDDDVINLEEEPAGGIGSDTQAQFRRFFLASSQSTQRASQQHTKERVLAEKSDSDDEEKPPFRRPRKHSSRNKKNDGFAVPKLP